MTNYQEKRLYMYMGLSGFLIPYSDLTKDLPDFVNNLNVFQDIITKIQAISEEQKFDITGMTEKKKELKRALIEMAADNARKISALAKLTNDTELSKSVKIGKSGLNKISGIAVRDYSLIIHNIGQANIEALARFEITSETLKSFLDLINSFNASLTKPRAGITEKKQATSDLALLFESADATLEKMDAAIDIIRLTQVKFYGGYRTARKQLDTGTTTLALKATANEMGNGEPVKGAIFAFKPEVTNLQVSSSNGEMIKKTAGKGIFIIKNMPAGTYTVQISKPGYKNKTATVSVAEGEMAELKVEMERI
jgi:Carboxypeptidase regulatory-like domain